MQIRFDLLRLLSAYMDSLPEVSVNMNTIFMQNPDVAFGTVDAEHKCGTIGCAFGHAGHMPEFNALGLSVDRDGRIEFLGEHYNSYSIPARSIFGIQEPSSIFGALGYSSYDQTNPGIVLDGEYVASCDSHLGVFQHRLRCFFEEHREVL